VRSPRRRGCRNQAAAQGGEAEREEIGPDEIRKEVREEAGAQAQAEIRIQIMSRRRLSDDERALWSGTTRSIAPFRWRPVAEPGADAEPVSSRQPPPKPKPPAAINPVPRPTLAPPPLMPLGRRFKQEVARGRRAIDGRLDLHGLTQAEAHSALLRFLHA